MQNYSSEPLLLEKCERVVGSRKLLWQEPDTEA